MDIKRTLGTKSCLPLFSAIDSGSFRAPVGLADDILRHHGLLKAETGS